MNTKFPLQVYLDSSDYSNLSTGPFSAEMETLKKLVKERIIEVRYSNITVSELIHTEKKYQHFAISRAKVLKELCGKKCLIYTEELLFHDCVNAMLGQERLEPNFPAYAYSDKAHWYPPRKDLFKNFKSELAKDITQRAQVIINQHPDPIERKRFRKRLKGMIRKGNFTEEGLGIFEGLDGAILEKFAFLDKTSPSEMVRKHLIGRISHRELGDYLLENGADPANLAEFTIDQVEGALSNLQWLREGGTTFIDQVKQFIVLADSIEELDKIRGISRSRVEIARDYRLDFRDLRLKLLQRCWSSFKDDFRKRGISHSNYCRNIEASKIGVFPSIDIIVEILPSYVELMLTKNRNNLLPSDLGDLAHLMYLPYVDIFRADKAMTHLFSRVSGRYQTRVIPKLKQLVSELETIAAQ